MGEPLKTSKSGNGLLSLALVQRGEQDKKRASGDGDGDGDGETSPMVASVLKKTWSFSAVMDVNARHEVAPPARVIAGWDGLRSLQQQQEQSTPTKGRNGNDDDEEDEDKSMQRMQRRVSALPVLVRHNASSPNLVAIAAAGGGGGGASGTGGTGTGGVLRLYQQQRPSRLSNGRSFRRFRDCYRMGKTLGTGGFAVVRECFCLKTGSKFAVKVMYIEKENRAEKTEEEDDEDEDEAMTREEIINELTLMQRLDHPNLVKIHEYFLTTTSCFIVMDILEGPEMMEALEEHGEYKESDVCAIMKALLDAVSYMHAKNVTHRDLKLENLVLRKRGQLSSVTIVDFGLARAARARQKMEETCGTAWYAAPELLSEQPYTHLVDSWALGVAMHVLLSGRFPYDSAIDDEDEVMDQVLDPAPVSLDGVEFRNISAEAKDVLCGLLEKNPRYRLSASDALEHAWVTKLPSADAKTITHFHARLERLGNVRGGRLPKAQFKRGEILYKADTSGSGRTAATYLIKRGECHLLIKEEHKERKIATLREGNFIGFIDLLFDEAGARPGQGLLSNSLCSPPFGSSFGGRDGHHDHDHDNDHDAHGDDDDDEEDDALEGDGHHPNSFEASIGSLGRGGLAGLAGANIIVRAASTIVDAIQLDVDDMRWAVSQDFRLTDSFTNMIKARRRKLRLLERERRAKQQQQ